MPRIPLAKQQQFERDPSQPQSPEDERGPNYQNDTQGWVRGSRSGPPSCFDEDATNSRPGGFDHSPPQKRR
jgi:hypothetical protein